MTNLTTMTLDELTNHLEQLEDLLDELSGSFDDEVDEDEWSSIREELESVEREIGSR